MATGTLFSFEEAHALGLVNQVWGEADLNGRSFRDALLDYARQFTPPHRASKAVGHIKRAVQSGLEMSFADGLALERELQQRLFESDDAQRGDRGEPREADAALFRVANGCAVVTATMIVPLQRGRRRPADCDRESRTSAPTVRLPVCFVCPGEQKPDVVDRRAVAVIRVRIRVHLVRARVVVDEGHARAWRHGDALRIDAGRRDGDRRRCHRRCR